MAADDKAMNDAIKDRLLVLGMTQRALAKKVGVGPQAVNKWVKGETQPKAELWSKIDDALEWPKGEMFRLAGWSAPPGGSTLDPAIINQLSKVMKEVARFQALVEQAAPESPPDPESDG